LISSIIAFGCYAVLGWLWVSGQDRSTTSR